MFWIPIMMAMSSMQQSQQKNADLKLQDSLNTTNTKIANLQRQGNNLIGAAAGHLNRITQSIKNQETMRQTGLTFNQVSQEQAKLADQMTTGTFTHRLDAAAKAGELAAASSAAGVGGGTVDMINSTLALRSAIEEQEAETQYNSAMLATEDQQHELTRSMYTGLDTNVFLDDVNPGLIIGPPKSQQQSTGSMMLQAGLQAVQGMYSTGEFSKGGTFDMSATSTKAGNNFLQQLFKPKQAGTTGSTNANQSFFQLGGTMR